MFSHLDDPRPPSPGPALAHRVRAEGRRRRVRRVRFMGGAGAVVILAASAALIQPWADDDQQGVVSNSPPFTAPPASSPEPPGTPESTTPSTPLEPVPEAPTSTEPPPAPGSLESATSAIRAACRRFYNYDPSNFERMLTPAELAERCDAPGIEWRSDCYADRPAEFVPGDGGCAYLGGYLAVWYGERPDRGDAGDLFRSGNDTWTVIPESD